jgi:hypothetical protein
MQLDRSQALGIKGCKIGNRNDRLCRRRLVVQSRASYPRRRTPQMNKHAEPFREEASGIADRLLGPERISDSEATDPEVREGLYIRDVREEARQFRNDADILRGLGLPFPAIRAAENRNVPVSLANHFGFMAMPNFSTSPAHVVPHPYHADYLNAFVREWEQTASERRVTLGVDTAIESFRSDVVEFLATRIASVAEFFGRRRASRPGPSRVSLVLSGTWPGQARVKTVGFKVNVHTSTANLRIHVSPSFRRSWRYFGAPTSPAKGTLTGGIYEFAADGSPYPGITPDPGTFDIPYATVSPKLNL